MSAPTPQDNFSLKEEIRSYWSARAESSVLVELDDATSMADCR